ncbi:MAG: hypothetical protein QOJ51_7124, partial [Acidobacteriaceae bacterium]|nr:hypothetical protein [Acidobacteriaceae bacterium]
PECFFQNSHKIGFVVEVENIWLGCAKHGKIEKVTGSQDDDFVVSWRCKNSARVCALLESSILERENPCGRHTKLQAFQSH